MKNSVVLSMIVATVIGFSSCRKSVNDSTVPQAAITILSPVMNQTYQKAQPVTVEGFIEGQTALHGYSIVITTSSGDTLDVIHNHTHAKRLEINETWINTLAEPTDMNIKIISEINHDGLSVSETISIKAIL